MTSTHQHIITSKPFPELPDILKDRVVKVLRDMIDNVYGFYPHTKQLAQVLHEQKSVIEFVVLPPHRGPGGKKDTET